MTLGTENVDGDNALLLNEKEVSSRPPSGQSNSSGTGKFLSSCCNVIDLCGMIGPSGSSKIDHRRRQCAIFALIILSIFSFLFVMIPYYNTPSLPTGKIYDYFPSNDYDSAQISTIIMGHVVSGDFPTTTTPRFLQFYNQPIANSNAKLVLPSYPIFPKPQPILEPLQSQNDTNATKVILFWTKLFGRDSWALNAFGRQPFLDLKCPISNCIVTNDRSRLSEADAVLIHFRDDFGYSPWHVWRHSSTTEPNFLVPGLLQNASKTPGHRDMLIAQIVKMCINDRFFIDQPTAQERKLNQRWTFVIWETPDHTYDWIWQSSHAHYRKLKDFSNFFNWTMTYRLDSDVRFHYGRYIPLPEPDFSRIGFDRLANKTKSAVWMTSHCDTASHRESYVKELLKYLDVDTIGGCGSNMPGLTSGLCYRPSHLTGSKDECLDYLSQTYKFYLSFENSLCRDYVTEKFYRAAKMDLIPVVLNGADMSLFAPPHSYIDAQQFSSPADLAKFLKKVGSDPALYNSYFWWKPFYDVEHLWDKASFVKHFCDLCAKVTYASSFERKSYEDIDRWWTTDGRCHEGKTFT